MINDIIKIISSFIYPRNIDIYSLETDYMDVYETNFKDLYEIFKDFLLLFHCYYGYY